jgi:hypothetical protein
MAKPIALHFPGSGKVELAAGVRIPLVCWDRRVVVKRPRPGAERPEVYTEMGVGSMGVGMLTDLGIGRASIVL